MDALSCFTSCDILCNPRKYLNTSRCGDAYMEGGSAKSRSSEQMVPILVSIIRC
jgi:hypothetical protein